MAVELLYWEVSREEERDRGKKEERPGREGKGRGWFFVASRGSRTSPRWPGHKQEVAHSGYWELHAAA
jgi:hypothetical protein